MDFTKYFNVDTFDLFPCNDNYPKEFLDETFWLDLIP